MEDRVPARWLQTAEILADPGTRSRRRRQDRIYQAAAHEILSDAAHQGEFPWLWDLRGAESGDADASIQPGILAELGRLSVAQGYPENEAAADRVLAWALAIEEERPTTTRARALLRQARGGELPHRRRDLSDGLIHAINTHLERAPETTIEDIHRALNEARLAVDTSLGGDS